MSAALTPREELARRWPSAAIQLAAAERAGFPAPILEDAAREILRGERKMDEGAIRAVVLRLARESGAFVAVANAESREGGAQ